MARTTWNVEVTSDVEFIMYALSLALVGTDKAAGPVVGTFPESDLAHIYRRALISEIRARMEKAGMNRDLDLDNGVCVVADEHEDEYESDGRYEGRDWYDDDEYEDD